MTPQEEEYERKLEIWGAAVMGAPWMPKVYTHSFGDRVAPKDLKKDMQMANLQYWGQVQQENGPDWRAIEEEREREFARNAEWQEYREKLAKLRKELFS